MRAHELGARRAHALVPARHEHVRVDAVHADRALAGARGRGGLPRVRGRGLAEVHVRIWDPRRASKGGTRQSPRLRQDAGPHDHARAHLLGVEGGHDDVAHGGLVVVGARRRRFVWRQCCNDGYA